MRNLAIAYEMCDLKRLNNTRPEIIVSFVTSFKRHLPPGKKLVTLALSFLFILTTFNTLPAASRGWTNLKGDKITASLKDVQGKEIVLETAGGTTINYPRWALIPEDQAYISTWEPFLHHELGSLLQGDLVVLGDNGNAEGSPLAEYQDPPEESLDVIALYFSAGFSPYCREFTPALVDFYEDHRRHHENFEVILLNSDPSLENMIDYMEDFDMPWPAVRYSVARNLPNALTRLRGSGIPNLVLVGRDGEVIADAFQNGEYVGPGVVLETFRTLLEHGLPAPPEEMGEAVTSATDADAPAPDSADAPATAEVPVEPLATTATTGQAEEESPAPAPAEAETEAPSDAPDTDDDPFGVQTETDTETDAPETADNPFGAPAETDADDESESSSGFGTTDSADDNPFGTTD